MLPSVSTFQVCQHKFGRVTIQNLHISPKHPAKSLSIGTSSFERGDFISSRVPVLGIRHGQFTRLVRHGSRNTAANKVAILLLQPTGGLRKAGDQAVAQSKD